MHHPNEEVTVALVGKYIDLPDAYLSVAEALRAGGFAHEAGSTSSGSPPTSAQTPEGAARKLAEVDAICVPGGFGIRGIEGKLGALTYARTNKIPTLGLCLGLQCMVIEFARSMAGLDKAASTEFDPDCPEPVIATMAEQHAFVEGAGDLGGTMRLGLYPADLKDGTVVRAAYGEPQVEERHRHRYEVNNTYRDQLEAAGLVFSGTSPDNNLVEFVELPADVHPYYVATQAHPELRSRPTRPHPLFAGLVEAAIQRQRELLIPIDESALRRRWVADERRGRCSTRRPPTPRSRGARASGASPRLVSRAARRRAAQLAGPGHPRAPPRRVGGRAARGRGAASRPSRGDLQAARARAPRRRGRARGRRRGAGLLPAAVPPRRRGRVRRAARRHLRRDRRGPPGHRGPRAARGGRAAGRALAPAGHLYPSAGITGELHHIYLATGLSHADRGDFELHAEEAEIEQLWVPFEELLDAVLDGRVRRARWPRRAAYDALKRRGRL